MTTAFEGDRMAFVATGAPHHPDLTEVGHDDVTETIAAVDVPPVAAPTTIHRNPYLAQDLKLRTEYARRFALLGYGIAFCIPAAIFLYGLAVVLILVWVGWVR